MEVHLKDLPEKNIYLLLKDEFRFYLFNELFKKFKNKLKSAEEVEVIEGYSLTRYQKGLRYCPLWIIKKICNILNYDIDKIEKQIEKIKYGSSGKTGFSKSIKNPKFPIKESPALAEIMARFIGDGCFNINKKGSFMLSYSNRNEILHKNFKNKLFEIFGELEIVRRRYESTIPSITAPILLCFNKYYGSFDAEVPKFVIGGNNEIKSSFLRSIFEDDGGVYHKGDRRSINFCSASEKVISQVYKLLTDLDIYPNKIVIRKKKTNLYTFTITGRSNFENFKKNIDFTKGYYKYEILKGLINSYKKFQTRVGENQKKILLYLSKNKGIVSTNDLCKELQLKGLNTLRHLNILEKQGEIIKIIKKPLRDNKGRLLRNCLYWKLK